MRRAALFAALQLTSAAFAAEADWQRLPSLPDAEGFASPFAGVTGGALLVAGGANLVGDKWREPFTKRWYDRVFILPRPDGTWQEAGTLPRPLAYGVSITTPDGVVCLGGSDAERHYPDAFCLSWQAGGLARRALPALPQPCANACGALVGRTIYLAGGLGDPHATRALRTFWALQLDDLAAGWRLVEPWPGPPRMLAVAAAYRGDFLLFSGADLSPGADGRPVRRYLRDAYRFTPGRGWQRLAELPRAAVAAASPAFPRGAAELLIVSGDDGAHVDFQPVRDHPGFPRDVLVYAPDRDRWSVEEGAPFSRATVPVVRWADRIIIPNGEVRPRVRTPEVWSWQAR